MKSMDKPRQLFGWALDDNLYPRAVVSNKSVERERRGQAVGEWSKSDSLEYTRGFDSPTFRHGWG